MDDDTFGDNVHVIVFSKQPKWTGQMSRDDEFEQWLKEQPIQWGAMLQWAIVIAMGWGVVFGIARALRWLL
jgi:hypothetical protein